MLTNMPSATSRNRYRRFSFSVFPLGSFTLSTLVLSAGLLQRHQSAQDPIPWLHQRLWGSYANGVRAQSQNTLHRTVTHHKEAERGESAQIYPAAGEDHIVLVHRVVLLCVYVFGGGFVSLFFTYIKISQIGWTHEPFVNLSAHLREEQDSQANVIWLWVCCCLLQIIKKLIERKQNQIRKVYPGLTCFKEGVRQIPVESIPGISKSTLMSW